MWRRKTEYKLHARTMTQVSLIFVFYVFASVILQCEYNLTSKLYITIVFCRQLQQHANFNHMDCYGLLTVTDSHALFHITEKNVTEQIHLAKNKIK